jgi:hypothetical protein
MGAIRCRKCKTELADDEQECPVCHSTMKEYDMELSDTVVLSERKLKVDQKDSDGFAKVEAISLSKKGGKSGRPAREEQVYDHTDPKKTIKTHKVSERNEQGEWEEVHNTRDEFPAKRRNPKSGLRKSQT